MAGHTLIISRMSFWPFGQSLNNSNINRILDDYFKVLHALEKSNPAVAKCVHQNFNNGNGLSPNAQNMSRDEISVTDLNDVGIADTGDSGDTESDLQNGVEDSLTQSGQGYASTGGTPSSLDSSSSKTRNSSLTSDSESSKTDSDEDDINSATEPMRMTIKSLNSSFIDKLLEESELLNELTRQNSTLLDFICFGFFYDPITHAKVQNIEYLIDLMLDCVDRINTPSEELGNAANENQNDNNDAKSDATDPPKEVVNPNLTQGCMSQIDRDSNGGVKGDSNPRLAQDANSDDDNSFVENIGDTNDEQEEPNFLSRATIISEIFSLDIWLITESLVNNQTYLCKIWSILNHPQLDSEKSPLMPIFLKINQNLLMTRQDQYLNFIRSRSTLVDDMLEHVGISMLMDFFLKCMATDKVESPTGIIELVYDQDLVPKFLAFLNNDIHTPDIQACAGDFLKALIAISANAPLDDMSIGPNSLTRQLVSPEIIDNLVQTIIKKGGSALNITVSIVIELIRKNNSDYDQVNLLTTTIQSHPPSNRDPIYLGYMLKEFALELPSLFKIILDADNSGEEHKLENQLHEYYVPLGFERFKVVELIAELLHCSNMGLMNSKKAERINRERDNCRKELSLHLQDALEELAIEENTSLNEDRSSIGNIAGNPNSEDTNSKESHVIDKINNRNTNDNHYDDDDYDDDDDDYEADDDKADDDDKIDDTNDNNTINDESSKISSSASDNLTNNEKLASQRNSSSIFESSDEEIDESFEIPYVNENQSSKLRKAPTIGDLFKIKLYDTQILPKIIELFLSHPWNNFWHNVIFDIIQQIFNGRMDFSYNSFLVYSLFNLKGSLKFMSQESVRDVKIKDFELTKDLILRGYKDSYDFYGKKHTNLGYMGHLVLIAEEVVKFSKLYKVELISPDIHDTLKDEEWLYYSENVLNDTRLMYSKILGGGNYVDDGNGNIIPQLNEQSNDIESSQAEPIEGIEGGGLINVEALEEQLGLSTESDLHEKLRSLLIRNSQQSVDSQNKKNGVIILGPPSEEAAAIEEDT